MLPFLQIGSLTLSTYALVYAFAILAAGAVFYLLPAATRADERIRRAGSAILILMVLVGVVIPAGVDVLLRRIAPGGPAGAVLVRVYYGVGLGLLAGFFYARRKGIAFLPAADRAVISFALAFSIARWGCLAAGCCGGIQTDSPLGVFLPDSHGHWAPRYPTQMISCGIEFLLFAALLALYLWLTPRRGRRELPAWLRAPGWITFTYLFLFSLERFALEFLRLDHAPILGTFSVANFITLGMALAALAWLAWRFKTARPQDVITH